MSESPESERQIVPRPPALPAERPAPSTHRHPTLGLPPMDMTAGYPAAAERLRLGASRLGARALAVAIDYDPSLARRYDEIGLRHLRRDAEVLVDRLARTVASGDPLWMREWAEHVSPVFRRRGVAMADVVGLCEGLRDAAAALMTTDERVALDRGLDAAITVFAWHGRLAGDARARHPLLNLLYRGA